MLRSSKLFDHIEKSMQDMEHGFMFLPVDSESNFVFMLKEWKNAFLCLNISNVFIVFGDNTLIVSTKNVILCAFMIKLFTF